jgi:hypothetical protein
MQSPIVYVDHSEIVDGRLDELTARIAELADFVEANEPQIVAYAVYLDEGRRAISVVHIHHDVSSLATHFRVAGPVFANFVDPVRLQSIDVYGDVGDDVVDAPPRPASRRRRGGPPPCGFRSTSLLRNGAADSAGRPASTP